MRVSVYLFALEQFLCAWCLLAACGAAAGLAQRPRRLLPAAALCAAGTLLAALLPALRLIVLPLTLLSPLMVWPGMPRRLKLRMSTTALMLSLAFAGAVRLVQQLPLPGIACVLLPCLLLPRWARQSIRQPPPRCAEMEIRTREGVLRLTALVDTGNLLQDSLTGLPVTVLSRSAAEKLIHLPPPGELQPGMRLMGVRTASGSSLMTLFRPVSVLVLADGHWQQIETMLGIAPQERSGFEALLPAALFPPQHTQGG